MNTHIFEQPLTKVPDIPVEFGQDGGKFNYFYDQVADELDDDLVKRLKSQLDTLLIFAGLFAGVNSAFLALTLPMMSADPTDDTNALLLQLVKGGNSSIASAFLAALGQQWLVYYRKRSGGGPDYQRKEQLKKELGANRWCLELMLDDILPALLQIGLVIFSISFVIYLHTLSPSISFVIAGIAGTGLIFILGAALCATWDRKCPYQSPLSHLLCWTVDRMRPCFVAMITLIMWLLPERQRPVHEWAFPQLSDISEWPRAKRAASRILSSVGRQEDSAADLTVASIKKVILRSESPTALVHASANLSAINDRNILTTLIEDSEFMDRLDNLTEAAGLNWSPDSLPNCPLPLQSYARGLLHLALSAGTFSHFVRIGGRRDKDLLWEEDTASTRTLRLASICLFSREDLDRLSSFDISLYSDLQFLAYLALLLHFDQDNDTSQSQLGYLERLIKGLANGEPCGRQLLIIPSAITILKVQKNDLLLDPPLEKFFSILQSLYIACQ
ncbi:hypothetical protein FRB90_003804 [Tulasnella sp. 427]|nr:hypothetical protein FRB90_003804 [Tulasnella sp. 427]